MTPFSLEDFVAESNRIEGLGGPLAHEVRAHQELLAVPTVTVETLCRFVQVVANAELRDRVGMDVHVGQHVAPRGGPSMYGALKAVLDADGGLLTPYAQHVWYEMLHPFMDGNGRSGRALWLHRIGGIKSAPLGFLHSWYYQSLTAIRLVGGGTIR